MASTSSKTKRLVGLALLTAIVIVLQLMGSFIRFGAFSISLVLIPIVVGAALYGPTGGAWLGVAFAIAVLLSGDAALLISITPIGAVLSLLFRGFTAGLCAGLVYKVLLPKLGKVKSTFAAAVVCPCVNTGIFLLTALTVFRSALMELFAPQMGGQNFLVFLITAVIGFNFIFELGLNVILSPVIVRIIDIGRKN